MKKLILVLALAAPLLITESMAGPITSGGGFAVVCRNLKGRIETAEILDLYEARTKYGFTIIETKDDVEEDIRSVAINSNRVDGIDAHPSSPQSLRFINDEIKEIQDEMTSGDYENLINTFDQYFGEN